MRGVKIMTGFNPAVLVWRDAKGVPAPLLVDSPHSGRIYPADFLPACPALMLQQAEDTLVDDLLSNAPDCGAILIAASFPRAYIDVNRAIDDIDTQLLSASWPGPVRQSDKGRVGMGLVRRICKPGVPVYNRKLTVAEVQARIDTYYRPYHAALHDALDLLKTQFGTTWHLNCHSMPSTLGRAALHTRPDFVLGDRDGTSCSGGFTAFVADAVREMGYSVKINDPYKGVEILRRYGNPQSGVHSLQLEINRKLYLNEDTAQPHRGYGKLKADLTRLVEVVRAYTEDQIYAAAAD